MISYCPPWIKNCLMRLPLFLPEKPLSVALEEPVVIDFGTPVEEVDPQIGIENKCPAEVRRTDEPSRVKLILPERFWAPAEGARPCGTGSKVDGSLDILYADGTFDGYGSGVGILLAPSRR